MAETHETIADIIAEIRALSNPISDGIIAINGRIIADRLEAAHKREKAEWVNANAGLAKLVDIEKLGDAAKLREALESCLDTICRIVWIDDPVYDEDGHYLGANYAAVSRDKARAALDAPPRNCDRPECATSKAAQAVWRKEDGGRTGYHVWLLATYKKGENNGR